MKKNKQKILLILLFLTLITVSTRVLADTLTVTTTAAKKEINIGDTTTVTVNWVENMQAADFILSYDNSKLKFKSTTVPEGNYANKDGKIKVMWYSSSQTPEDKKEFTFTFEGIAAGEAKIEFEIEGGFATGSLEKPNEYNLEASKTAITILGAKNNENTDDEGTNTENDNSGNTNSGNGNENTGNGAGEDKETNSVTKKPNIETQKNNKVSTNPTEIPNKLPKAGKIQIVGILFALLGMISFSSYKLNKYKGI